MVDVKQIKGLLKTNFKINGSYKIDPRTGVVNVQGNVELIRKVSQLPVQFGHVGGYFICSDNKLKTLVGAPNHVEGGFYCNSNQLTSLAGAPDHVGGNFYCAANELISLSGAPEHVKVQFGVSYSPDLPLLRLCTYKLIKIFDSPDIVESIMYKHAGKGRPGALKAAAELIRAGYAENARW